jgi:hypothetical protein
MLDDIINAAAVPVYILAIGIFLFASYRALTIGRVLVRGAYRNRALWTAGTVIALILFTISTTLPSDSPLLTFSFLAIMLILLTFVDSSIKVAQDTDFFHRSPLGWQQVRKPLYFIVIGLAVLDGLFAYFEPANNSLFMYGEAVWFLAGAASIAYAAGALIVGARRTPDRSMRRFVRTLGLAIVCMVIFFTIWIPFQPFSVTVQDLGNLISELFIPAAAYYLYLAVMSLSPVGHVEKESFDP